MGPVTTPDYFVVSRSEFAICVHIDFASTSLFVHEQVRQCANYLAIRLPIGEIDSVVADD